jgi:hypothetical protein
MTKKHTPGPWTQRAGQRFIIAAPMDIHIAPGEPPRHFDDAKEICEVRASPVRAGIEESEANARLIAAAPELLAACRALVDVLNDDLDTEQCAAWDTARDAIAKATAGENP